MASKQRAREITSATAWKPPSTTTAAPVHVSVKRETGLYCKGLAPDADIRWIWQLAGPEVMLTAGMFECFWLPRELIYR